MTGFVGTRPSVAVVIPTHRRGHILREALNSVANQTVRPLEVIVVSDCEDADSAAVCEEVSRTAGMFVSYIEATDIGRGPSSTRNLGTELAQSEVIAFLDDDDWWHEKHLEASIDAMARSGCQIVVTWMEVARDSVLVPGPSLRPGLTASDVIAMNQGTTGSNIVVKREAIVAVSGFDTAFQNKEDTDFFYRLLRAGFHYDVVKTRHVYQRSHGASRLTDDSESRAKDQEAYLRKHGRDMTFRDRRRIRRVIHYIRAHLADDAPHRAAHRLGQLWNSSFSDFSRARFHGRGID